MKTIINPDQLAKPTGYSHAIATRGGTTLYLSGQPALDASGSIIARGDLVAQFRQALANIQIVLQEAGGAMPDIVKATFYARDRDDYKANLKSLGGVWREFFGKYYPATTLVEVSNLFDDGALIEIDVIAVIDS